MFFKRTIYPILAICIVLILASLACGSSSDNSGTKVGEVGTTSNNAEPTAVPTLDVFKVGDMVQVKGFTMILTNVDYHNGKLEATFSFDNESDKEVTISSLLSFDARSDDGTKLEQEYFDCGSSTLDGKILPGDKLKGSICYNGVPKTGVTKIYYTDNPFLGGATVFAVDMEQLISTGGSMGVELPADSGNSANTVETFGIGDVVQLSDQTITLNSAEFSNNLLKANFTIENQGASEVPVSSMLSFTAKSPDGTKLEQNIFDCSSSSLDGSVMAGDKLRGDLCYNLSPGTEFVNIYYEADLLGSGATVWRISP